MPRRAFNQNTYDHVTLAIIARSIAALGFAVMSALAKMAGNAGANPGEIIFFRSAFALPIVIVWIMTGPGLAALRTRRPKAHFTRALIGLTSMSVMFYSLSLLPLAEAVTIFFIAPLIATCLSAVLLGDHVGVHRWTAIAIGLIGVVLVMQPDAGLAQVSKLGLAMASLAAILMACVTLTLRQLGTTENEAATVFWFTLTGTVVMGCLYPFFYHPHDTRTWLMMAGLGACGAVIQIGLTTSLRLASISVTAPFDYMQLFWAAVLGWLLWSDLPPLTTVIGGFLITAAGLYTFYRERLKRQSIAIQSTPLD